MGRNNIKTFATQAAYRYYYYPNPVYEYTTGAFSVSLK